MFKNSLQAFIVIKRGKISCVRCLALKQITSKNQEITPFFAFFTQWLFNLYSICSQKSTQGTLDCKVKTLQ